MELYQYAFISIMLAIIYTIQLLMFFRLGSILDELKEIRRNQEENE